VPDPDAELTPMFFSRVLHKLPFGPTTPGTGEPPTFADRVRVRLQGTMPKQFASTVTHNNITKKEKDHLCGLLDDQLREDFKNLE